MWAERPEVKDQIGAIGISYQMHGLVAVDAKGEVLRPSISDLSVIEAGRLARSIVANG